MQLLVICVILHTNGGIKVFFTDVWWMVCSGLLLKGIFTQGCGDVIVHYPPVPLGVSSSGSAVW